MLKHLRMAAVVILLVVAPASASPAPTSPDPTPPAPPSLASGSSSAGGPTILPGAVSSNCVLTDSCTYDVPTTSYSGDSTSVAYNLPVVARWAAPQRIEVGYAGASVTRQIGILAFHQPSAADLSAGKDDDICSVDVTVDGGPAYTITSPTWNADDRETDWNFKVTSGPNWSDGYHRVDAVIKPCNGPSLVMRGPLEYSPTDHVGYTSTENGGVTISGNTMTVTPGTFATNKWRVGWDVMGIGIEPNTRITALRAGTGGAGTYTVSGPAQTVSTPTPATGAQHNSFWFITNYHGTLNRFVEYISNSGNDRNTGDSAASPKATIGQAAARIWARDTTNHGIYGGVICVMGGGTFWANEPSPTGNRLGNNYGWLDIVKAEGDPRCGVAGSAADPTIKTDTGANASAGNAMERWAHVRVDGALEANVATWADYVTAYGFGLNWKNNGHQEGLLVFHAAACTNSTIIGYFSGCRGEIVRNNTMQFITEDFFHGATIIVGNTVRDGGSVWLRVTGTATRGSNVITGVSVPSGFTLAQLFATSAPAITAEIDLAGCFGGGNSAAVVSAVDDAAHTITLRDERTGASANATCTATGQLSAAGVHGDFIQYQSMLNFGNAIIINNDADDATIGYQQGLFAEVPVDGLVYKGNKFRSQMTPEYYINIANGQYNWTHSGNTWDEEGSSTGGFNLNGSNHSFWLDVNNTCVGRTTGGFKTYTPGGKHVRRSGGTCR